MNKVEIINGFNISNLEFNKEKFFIEPFYDNKLIVYITIDKNIITWNNNDFKNITPYKRINKSLLYFYENSKYYGYKIVIIGFLIKLKNYNFLCVLDLLLNDEFLGNIQSKKYSTRLDNINLRFIKHDKKFTKNVFSIFSYKYNDEIFNNLFNQCILTGKWDGYMLHRDIPFKYLNDSANEIISYKLWNIEHGIIINTTIKNEINKSNDNKLINVNKLNSIIVKNINDQKIYEIFDGFSDTERINLAQNSSNILNKKILYKKLNFNNIEKKLYIGFFN